MAKKQSKKLGKKLPTLQRQRAKKLSKLANKHLEHFDNVDLLRKVGEKAEDSTLISSLGSIFETTEEIPKDTFTSNTEDVLNKLKALKKLIILNISNTEGKRNFNAQEYIDDRKSVVDVEFKIQSSGQPNKADLSMMNKLYKKHKRIKQLFD